MKLIWSPENATKAYIDTVPSCEVFHESGVAELVSARVESRAHHDQSRAVFVTAMKEAGMAPEVLVGEPEEVMAELVRIDFLVVDSKRKDFARVLRQSPRGAVLVCKNADSRSASSFRWRSVVDCGSRRIYKFRSPNRKIKKNTLGSRRLNPQCTTLLHLKLEAFLELAFLHTKTAPLGLSLAFLKTLAKSLRFESITRKSISTSPAMTSSGSLTRTSGVIPASFIAVTNSALDWSSRTTHTCGVWQFQAQCLLLQ
ncbi:unnamed protein product [Prunus armeniaca]|uniref:Uncharacterized protein n=1 Tax=Prunus armeniaca TaxID=36596 RepID=A0A6J5X0S7_PRUAR|nr:unnamed protein product [Prunus armeniaca]